MSGCLHRDAYLDGRLSHEQRAGFERHVESCVACAHARDEWDVVTAGLNQIVRERDVDAPPLHHPGRVAAAAMSRGQARILKWRPLSLGFAAAAAVVLAVVLFSSEPAPLESTVELTLVQPGDGAITQEDGVVVAATREKPARARLGRDTLALAPATRLRVATATRRRTRLLLERGRAAFAVDTKQQNRQFEVQLGALATVHVTGTKFGVSLVDGGAEVVVSRGSVKVRSAGGGLVRLSAGEMVRLATNTAPVRTRASTSASRSVVELLAGVVRSNPDGESGLTQPPSSDETDTRASAKALRGARKRSNAAPEYTRWSRNIGAGRCAEVRTEIEERVEAAPKDARAWSMLADCARKMSRWRHAATAYERVIRHGDSRLSNRARYLAAQIYDMHLDELPRAAALLRTFLAKEPVASGLVASARVRLGSALLRLKETKQARSLLEEVVRSHPGSQAAREATELLNASR